MTELLRTDCVKKETTHSYKLKTYKITKDGLTESGNELLINLVKGGKDKTDGKQEGVTTEQLLALCLEYLNDVNVGDFKTKDTSLAITHIENALLRIEKRNQDRKFRGVKSTYKK